MNTEFKTCGTCAETKPIELFHKTSAKKGSRNRHCKKCHHERFKKFRKNPANKPKLAQYQRNSGIKRRYGITSKQFEEMVLKQENKCLICGDNPVPNGPYQSFRLHIDHCHKTKKIRGLLCHLCNRGIGLFRERIDLLKKAIEYLESHE